ncbi:hypothetical protein K435DRAFT_594046, partial [Dendrothele bispora CBS 962.96]
NYSADLDYSIEHLESSGTNPYLPRKQWKSILQDRYVELTEVLAALAPSKPVMDQVNWRRAWRATSEAILCAFPDRRKELDRYENHIQRLFESHVESTHPNIIRYDRAV